MALSRSEVFRANDCAHHRLFFIQKFPVSNAFRHGRLLHQGTVRKYGGASVFPPRQQRTKGRDKHLLTFIICSWTFVWRHDVFVVERFRNRCGQKKVQPVLPQQSFTESLPIRLYGCHGSSVSCMSCPDGKRKFNFVNSPQSTLSTLPTGCVRKLPRIRRSKKSGHSLLQIQAFANSWLQSVLQKYEY